MNFDLTNKSFRNNQTGEVVKVIDSFENIAILENKEKIDAKRLLDGNYYTEYIDPKNFFNNQSSYNVLAEKIKSIPSDHITDEGAEDVVVINADGNRLSPISNESAVIESDPEQEKLELAQKYSNLGVNVDSLQKQNNAFSKILGEDSDDLPVIPQRQEQPVVTQVIVDGVEKKQVSKTVHHQSIQANDPVTTMFRNVKRNLDFKMTLDISNKIPRIDFIEMMEDAYEISIIDFLADEFTNKILNDPSVIREMIKSKLKQVVYGGEVKKPTIEEKKIIKKAPRKASKSGAKNENTVVK